MKASPRTRLLVIDPQNDFMDIAGAALPVAGALADMQRLAAFVDGAGDRLAGIVVTLDSHHSVGIERPAFWRQGDGSAVAPFTTITAAQVRVGAFAPRRAQDLTRALAYLDALEAGGRYQLMVWPVHCEISTWGHNIEETLRQSLRRWEAATLQAVRTVFKGTNPWTESYSALQAEVPDAQDPDTQLNTRLIAELDDSEAIVIAGEASSHCVRATAEHLAAHLPSGRAEKIVLLEDCMSPVGGFEPQASTFLADMRSRGASVTTAAACMARLS